MWVKAGIGGENSERGRGKSGGREGRETQEERGDGDERERMRVNGTDQMRNVSG